MEAESGIVGTTQAPGRLKGRTSVEWGASGGRMCESWIVVLLASAFLITTFTLVRIDF